MWKVSPFSLTPGIGREWAAQSILMSGDQPEQREGQDEQDGQNESKMRLICFAGCSIW